MSEITDKISKQLADAVGPDVILSLVTKSITDSIDGYTSKTTIEKVIQPAVVEAATKFIETEKCKKMVNERVLNRISGLVESAVDKTLSKLVKSLQNERR